jgi:hypothetical protein
LVSQKLERFSWKRSNVACCRCPICGDSKTNKTKTRFFFFQENSGKYFVKCHNCGFTNTFQNFLKDFDDSLFADYRIENLREKYGTSDAKTAYQELVSKVQNSQQNLKTEMRALTHCTSINELPSDHYARSYVESRRIPEERWHLLYHSEDFNATCAQNLGCAVRSTVEARLVIPFFSATGELFAIQGRSYDPESRMRYMTLRSPAHKITKIYGLERLNPAVRNYCLEGPIDSLFLPNAIALAGSMVNYDEMGFDTQNTVFIYDNEPRNTQIVSAMQDVAQRGFRICVFPSSVTEKDLNDMVKVGIDVKNLVDTNTFQGLAAVLAVNNWKR